MIKIRGKLHKSNTYKGFKGNISFFSSSVNKERNITTKLVVFDLSTFSLIFTYYLSISLSILSCCVCLGSYNQKPSFYEASEKPAV